MVYAVMFNSDGDRSPNIMSNGTLHSVHKTLRAAEIVSNQIRGTHPNECTNETYNSWVEKSNRAYVLLESKDFFSYSSTEEYMPISRWMTMKQFERDHDMCGNVFPGGDVVVEILGT